MRNPSRMSIINASSSGITPCVRGWGFPRSSKLARVHTISVQEVAKTRAHPTWRPDHLRTRAQISCIVRVTTTGAMTGVQSPALSLNLTLLSIPLLLCALFQVFLSILVYSDRHFIGRERRFRCNRRLSFPGGLETRVMEVSRRL